ncbi:hypothetical protein [Dapis sp. BLCC M229]|uniref:hypothetical protein n=1 Tax=Dapis sp. BLCC M229 TaxID=3400188 RepID=UPI003CF6A538
MGIPVYVIVIFPSGTPFDAVDCELVADWFPTLMLKAKADSFPTNIDPPNTIERERNFDRREFLIIDYISLSDVSRVKKER